jgi:hypothetical protein
MESKQFSAAIAAIREMGVLSGQRIERREIGAPSEFEALTDDELLAALRERLRALGLAPDAGSALNVSIGSIALLATSRDPHDRNRLVRLN